MQLRSRGPAQTSLQDPRGHDADAVRERVQELSCPRLAADLTRNRTRTPPGGGIQIALSYLILILGEEYCYFPLL